MITSSRARTRRGSDRTSELLITLGIEDKSIFNAAFDTYNQWQYKLAEIHDFITILSISGTDFSVLGRKLINHVL